MKAEFTHADYTYIFRISGQGKLLKMRCNVENPYMKWVFKRSLMLWRVDNIYKILYFYYLIVYPWKTLRYVLTSKWFFDNMYNCMTYGLSVNDVTGVKGVRDRWLCDNTLWDFVHIKRDSWK